VPCALTRRSSVTLSSADNPIAATAATTRPYRTHSLLSGSF
jgi:hypothetical protein